MFVRIRIRDDGNGIPDGEIVVYFLTLDEAPCVPDHVSPVMAESDHVLVHPISHVDCFSVPDFPVKLCHPNPPYAAGRVKVQSAS